MRTGNTSVLATEKISHIEVIRNEFLKLTFFLLFARNKSAKLVIEVVVFWLSFGWILVEFFLQKTKLASNLIQGTEASCLISSI